MSFSLIRGSRPLRPDPIELVVADEDRRSRRFTFALGMLLGFAGGMVLAYATVSGTLLRILH